MIKLEEKTIVSFASNHPVPTQRKNPFPLNRLNDAQYAKVLEVIAQKFKIGEKNVDDLRDADIICFGERHKIDADLQAIGELIDIIGSENDLILLEHDENNSFRSNQARYVSKNIPEAGWDRVPLKRQLELYSAFLLTFFPSLIYQKGLLSPLMTGVICTAAYALAAYKIQKIAQQLINDVVDRNRNMFKKIEEKEDLCEKILVITGQDHIKPTDHKSFSFVRKLFTDYSPLDTAYAEMMQFLNQRKFVVLLPKT